MDKKYKYNVCLSADGEKSGTVLLTKKEAEVVAYATNPSNWQDVYDEGWSGQFWIDIDNPVEVEG